MGDQSPTRPGGASSASGASAEPPRNPGHKADRTLQATVPNHPRRHHTDKLRAAHALLAPTPFPIADFPWPLSAYQGLAQLLGTPLPQAVRTLDSQSPEPAAPEPAAMPEGAAATASCGAYGDAPTPSATFATADGLLQVQPAPAGEGHATVGRDNSPDFLSSFCFDSDMLRQDLLRDIDWAALGLPLPSNAFVADMSACDA